MSAILVIFANILLARPAAAADGQAIAVSGTAAGVTPCVACHGVDGAGSAAAGFPRIAGQDAAYIARQVTLIRDGQRTAPTMTPGVAALTDAEADAVAAYYADLPIPPTTAPPVSDPAAAALARSGDWASRDLPACESCHGPGSRGVGAIFPGIAGQHAGYLEAQLRAWQDGTRRTDPGDLMGTVARQLTEAEIVAVSAWLAAQPGAAQ